MCIHSDLIPHRPLYISSPALVHPPRSVSSLRILFFFRSSPALFVRLRSHSCVHSTLRHRHVIVTPPTLHAPHVATFFVFVFVLSHSPSRQSNTTIYISFNISVSSSSPWLNPPLSARSFFPDHFGLLRLRISHSSMSPLSRQCSGPGLPSLGLRIYLRRVCCPLWHRITLGILAFVSFLSSIFISPESIFFPSVGVLKIWVGGGQRIYYRNRGETKKEVFADTCFPHIESYNHTTIDNTYPP